MEQGLITLQWKKKQKLGISIVKAKLDVKLYFSERKWFMRKRLKVLIMKLAKTIDSDDLESIKIRSERWQSKNKGKELLSNLIFYFKFFYNTIVDFLSNKKNIPWKAAAISAAVLLYVINPQDLIPDYITVAGYADDMLVISLFYPIVKDYKT
jgi:uncharacterized membrane protein YkvA (DUF1232 family)